MKLKLIILLIILTISIIIYFGKPYYDFAKGELEDTKVRRYEFVPFHIDYHNVDSIQLIKVEHPLLGGVNNIKSLSSDKFDDFINEINNSKYVGLRKLYTCYVIRIKLKNGEIKRHSTNGTLISSSDKDIYYEIKNNSLESFFNMVDTINCNNN